MLDDFEKRFPVDGRERMLKKLLFIGGKTGQVLTAGLGERWCDSIVWEEATRKIAGKASGSFPADIDHMAAVLEKHKPDVVVTFGSIARLGLSSVFDFKLKDAEFPEHLSVCHPTARNANSATDLAWIKQKLNSLAAKSAAPRTLPGA